MAIKRAKKNADNNHYLGQELPEVTPVETGSVDDRDLTDHLKSAPSVKQEAPAVAESSAEGSAGVVHKRGGFCSKNVIQSQF